MKNPYADMQNMFNEDCRQQEAATSKLDEQAQTRNAELLDAADIPDLSQLTALPEKIEALCREHLCPSCPIKAEAEDTRLRSVAEMENFKRRLQREHEEQAKYAGEKILVSLLPALESMDLAIQYAGVDADNPLLRGVTMTRKQLLDALAEHGLTPVGELGEAFDHELHEAVGEEERADMPPMHVSSLLQRGYRLCGRLLRPAKVLVSRAPQ